MAGSGPLYDIGSQRIDVLDYLFGEPNAVVAQLSIAVQDAPVGACVTLLIEYQNKVRGIVDVRWHSRVNRDEFRIIGTKGEMNLTPLNGSPLVHPGGHEDLPTHPNVHYPCIKNFVDAVLDGAPLLASGASSIWTDWVTQEAMRSRRGRGDRNP